MRELAKKLKNWKEKRSWATYQRIYTVKVQTVRRISLETNTGIVELLYLFCGRPTVLYRERIVCSGKPNHHKHLATYRLKKYHTNESEMKEETIFHLFLIKYVARKVGDILYKIVQTRTKRQNRNCGMNIEKARKHVRTKNDC